VRYFGKSQSVASAEMAGRNNNLNHGGARKNAGRPSLSGRASSNTRPLTHHFNQQPAVTVQGSPPPHEEEQQPQQQQQQREHDAQEAVKQKEIREKARRDEALKHLEDLNKALKDDISVDLNFGEQEDDDGIDYNEDVDDRKRISSAYMPRNTSAIGIHLENIKNKVVGKGTGLSSLATSGAHWVAPSNRDPVAEGNLAPRKWYVHRTWAYIWRPFKQYAQLDIKLISCFSCGEHETYVCHDYDWRPMICLDKIVWVLHQRVKCKSCKKTIAEIDPRFLSKLLTRVAERFEFVTTVTGPGLHQSLVYSLLFLLGKAVMFGTFVKMVNELHAMFYTMDHISHMDSLAEYSR
jgi:hypothetical protein